MVRLASCPAFFLVAVLLMACSSVTREAHPSTLANTAWRAVTINGKPVVAGSEPTANFKVADVTGSSGCNDWFGSYEYDPSTGRLTLSQVGMTARACVDPAPMAVEAAFSQAIVAVESASMDPEGRLVLSGPGGEIVLAVDGFEG